MADSRAGACAIGDSAGVGRLDDVFMNAVAMTYITIAFAPDSQTQLLERINLANFPNGITAKSVVKTLGWAEKYPELLSYDIGVFAQKIDWNDTLKSGDRLEIYRPLTISPMRKRQLIMAQRQKLLNKQRAKNNIAKKQIDKKVYYNALRAEKGGD